MGAHDDPLRGRLMAGSGPLSPRASSEAAIPSPASTSPGAGAPLVRPRSSVYTPYGVMTAPQAAELDAFGEACRLMFAGDASAARTVEQTMRTIPAGAKASYTRTMAAVRSAWHRDAAASRRAEVDRLLMETEPASSIKRCIGFDSSIAALRSPRARQERKVRLGHFLAAHCVRDMAGVHPFFTSLYVVLHLLGLPAKAGGAGKRRIDWEIDTVVFSGTGPGAFLDDSIELLKGVLGFEDHLKPMAAPSYTASYAATTTSSDSDEGPPTGFGHSDGDGGLTLEERQEGELEDAIALDTIPAPNEGPFADSTGTVAVDGSESKGGLSKGKERASNRERATSDPFLDPQASDGETGAETPTLRRSPSITVSSPGEEAKEIPTGHRVALASPRQPVSSFLDAAPASEIRTFRAPSYITDTEIGELVRLFPSFISTKAKAVRFNRNAGAGKRADDGRDAFVLRPGHGVVSISVFERDEGWKGGLFERFKLFVLRLFGR